MTGSRDSRAVASGRGGSWRCPVQDRAAARRPARAWRSECPAANRGAAEGVIQGMRIITLGALVATSLAIAACGSSGSPAPAAAPATQAAPAAAPKPSPTCTLPVTPSYLIRTTEPGTTPTISEVGNADLADCTPTLKDFAATAGQGPGECDTIALASDNPGIDVYTSTAAPPLKDVIESAGPGC
jgi:OOP family OmpA-OmpF porin